jgi:predicted PurR-regulated permease PerM
MMLGFFLTLFLITTVLMGWLLWPFFPTLFLSLVVTGVFNPLYRLMRARVRPQIASMATCLVIFFVLFIPIVMFVGILSREAYGFYLMGKNAVLTDVIRNFFEHSQLLDRANELLGRFNLELSSVELNRAISQLGKVVGLFLYQQASSIASNVVDFVIYFFFMLMIVYFLLMDGDKLISFLINLSPLPREQDEKLIAKFKDIAGAILIGNGLGGLIQGILGGVVFYLFDLNSPFLWGVLMSLLAFLPIIGIGLVFIPAAIFLFFSQRIGAGIFFIVFYILLSGGIEYIFKPKLVGHRLQLHTLLVFLSIVGGLKSFGILGIIYGPVIVTAFLTLTDIYHTNYQKLVEPKEAGPA